jgi:UDP-4-amino-4,6-dideoxy-N-acetyl-beta-L-altrosamine transaminase
MIPYGRQSISDEDIDAVTRVLRSDFLTQGPAVPQFEQGVATAVGAKHAVAVNSATSALHIACLALDVGPGDLVWTSPNTFVASANCARYCGADVDFVDIEPSTSNMSVQALNDKLVAAKQRGRLPKVVIPVHFAGQPCDMREIAELGQAYGFKIIEDASHAIGAKYNNGSIGDCRYSDIAVFSFHPVKIITSGEGGMILTNNSDLADRSAMFRSHGITRDTAKFKIADQGPWYYEQLALGYNYRMIDLEAALGLSQLRRLDEFVDRRNELARRYDALLEGLPFVGPVVKSDRRSSFHLYVVRLPRADREAHLKAFLALRESGIGVNLHYIPVHLQPYYRELGFGPGMFPEAEAHAQSAISLPLYADLSPDQQDEVVAALQKAARHISL